MTLEELYTAMLTALPDLAEASFYDHIEVDEGQEIFPPFIFVHEEAGDPFMADDQVYFLGIDNKIDVYTADRSTTVRNSIINFLNGLNLPFTLQLGEIDSDTMLYVDSFVVSLDNI